MRHEVVIGTVIFFLVILAGQALGQTPPQREEAGAQAERFREMTERERKKVEEKKIKAPKIEFQKEAEKPAVTGSSFVLKEIRVTGATLFTPQDLKPVYESYIGKLVMFKDLEMITSRIEAKYKEQGFLSTAVYIPKQEISPSEGIVEIAVSEGTRGELKVEGNRWFSLDFIKKYFHIKKNELLSFKKLTRGILRLNQNPDLEVKTLISPGETPGSSDITLRVKDKFPWHAGAGVDNQGTRLTGKYRTSVYARSSNVTGYGDSLFVNTLFSAGSFGESVSYALPIDTYGTKLSFDYTYFWMKLGKEFSSFNITGNTQIYTPRISWEMALTENFTANINTGLQIKSIKRFEEGNTTSNDQLRLPYIGYDITNVDSFWDGGQNSFSPRFVFGTSNFLGASSKDNAKAGRPGTGGAFVKYEQYFSRFQKMPFESYLQIRSQFQLASRDLPSSEQLQLGGESSIRGYPEGDFLADAGASLNLDWIFPMYLFPKDWKLPHSDTPLRNQIEPCVFMDLGGGKLMKTLPGERKEKFLMGLGGGLRVRLYGKAFLKLEWAKAVGDSPISGAGPSTFYFTFQGEI